MKMKHMSKYIFSSFLLLCFVVPSHSQEKKTDSIKTPERTERYGLRVGADLFKFSRSFYDKNYKGLELVGDYRLTRKYYLAGEIGNENITTEDTQVNFTTKGSYFRVGFDYNAHENWLNLENMIYVGMRYGISTFSQELNSYKVYNPHPYFGEMPPKVSGEKYDGLSAQWIEVALGLKTKVFNNIFVGFSLRLNKLVSNKKPENFDNLYIPGFNKTYDGTFGIGFNYCVSYFIPIYKKKITPKKTAETPKKK